MNESSEYNVAITTFDNPYDPFTEYEQWNIFDNLKGYCSEQRVASLAHYFDGMTAEEEDEEYENAIDRLVKVDFLNIYKKVKVPLVS